jgi:HPt (histidine-containing phosphotransfer) domain-containing protein
VPVIAWERVTELREGVGEDDFAEVVDLFLDEVEGVLDRLRDRPSRDSLESDLHFVRGSALTLGFTDLGEVCQTGERLAAQAQFDAIDIGAVLAAYAASKTEFISRLS